MCHETQFNKFYDEQIPNNLDEAVGYLEAKVAHQITILEQQAPDPLAPMGERIAYTLAVARLRAETDVIATLYVQQDGGIDLDAPQ